MHILIDCDGVLADFSGHLLRLVGSELTVEDITEWDIFKFMTPSQLECAKMLLAGPEFWASQPQIPGAAEGVEELRSGDHTITVVTSPWYGCEVWGHVRREWLKRNFAVDAADVVVAARKERLQGEVFIDDKTENGEAWAAANPAGLAALYAQPYNRGDGRRSRRLPQLTRGRWHAGPGVHRIGDLVGAFQDSRVAR